MEQILPVKTKNFLVVILKISLLSMVTLLLLYGLAGMIDKNSATQSIKSYNGRQILNNY